MSTFQPHHSATHAIESLSNLLPRAAPSATDNILETRIREALHWLKVSAKFAAPPNGQFLERVDLVTEGVDFPRLPFNAICVEYDYVLNPQFFPVEGVELAAKEHQPDRACVLAFYPDPSLPTGKLALRDYGPMDDGEFLVWPICGFNAGRTLHGQVLREAQWIPGLDPVVVTTRRQSQWSMEMRASDADKRILLHALPTSETLYPRVESKLSRGLAAQSQEELVSEIIVDTGWEAMCVVELCNVLECTNVTTKLFDAPEKLNKKRLSNGRVPFFSYHVLNLVEPSAAKSPPGTGTHASPRQHYRRGHIRRLSPGRKTWVRPAMIGDAARGVVAKDYDVQQRSIVALPVPSREKV